MQSELTVVNNKDICKLINNLDDKNLTCTESGFITSDTTFFNSKLLLLHR